MRPELQGVLPEVVPLREWEEVPQQVGAPWEVRRVVLEEVHQAELRDGETGVNDIISARNTSRGSTGGSTGRG